MHTFHDWLGNNHPEAIIEGWGKSLMGIAAPAMLGAGYLLSRGGKAPENVENRPTMTKPSQGEHDNFSKEEMEIMNGDYVKEDGGEYVIAGAHDLRKHFSNRQPDHRDIEIAFSHAELRAKGALARKSGGRVNISGATVTKRWIKDGVVFVIMQVPNVNSTHPDAKKFLP